MKADQVLWEKHYKLLWLILPIAHDSKASFWILLFLRSTSSRKDYKQKRCNYICYRQLQSDGHNALSHSYIFVCSQHLRESVLKGTVS